MTNEANFFSVYGEVESVVDEMDEDGIMSDVGHMQLVVTHNRREETPYVATIAGSPELVSIRGRPPQCLRCKVVGHVRGECPASVCVKCRRIHMPDS